MATKNTAIQLTIGAIGGLALYHFVFRPLVPSLPALNNMNVANQNLRQENATLRKTVNEAMVKLAQLDGHTSPTTIERQKKYGAMVDSRNSLNRREHFGFMNTDETTTSSNVAKMFNMQ